MLESGYVIDFSVPLLSHYSQSQLPSLKPTYRRVESWKHVATADQVKRVQLP